MIAETRRMDRRKGERFAVEGGKVAYKKAGLFSFLSNQLVVNNPLVNLGQHGAQFITEQFIQLGTNLVLQVSVPVFIGGLCFKARVIWAIKIPQKKAYRVGVKFLKADRETAQRLDTLRKDVFFRTTKNRVGKPAKVG
jgi:Tfp pilus assembly protein PilZ